MRPSCTTIAPFSIGARASPTISRAPSYTVVVDGGCASASADAAATAAPQNAVVLILRFHHGLVDQRRELASEVGGVRQHLHHEHDDEPRLRIDTVRRGVGARPPERSG